jgi:hypothetical protein
MNIRWHWMIDALILLTLLPAFFIAGVMVGKSLPPPVPPVAAPPPLVRTINVPLAAADLPAGRKIRVSDVVLVPMTREQMSHVNVPLITVMISPEQIHGRVLKEALLTGEFFTTDKFHLEGDEPAEPDPTSDDEPLKPESTPNP